MCYTELLFKQNFINLHMMTFTEALALDGHYCLSLAAGCQDSYADCPATIKTQL